MNFLSSSRISVPETIDLADYTPSKSATELESLGPMIVHQYEVNNFNEYSISGVIIKIDWPRQHQKSGK